MLTYFRVRGATTLHKGDGQGIDQQVFKIGNNVILRILSPNILFKCELQ